MTLAEHERQLRLFLGTWGCRQAQLDPEQLVYVAKRAFDVQGRNIVEVSAAVAKLGKIERSARVREAIRKHWPEPSRLWPAVGNGRKLLAKEFGL